ncbi:hypothetical protein EW145_g5439 [Phellinidium pouzarii]|uniref:EXS domain-containing protein n=1 Tax=Phellinidium pouzarii TaxID=167371 RepID=A0A4S4L4R8_9AGAM|nr:hypothetical protein EW145_g5439 [Phellinidium pouzarii]
MDIEAPFAASFPLPFRAFFLAGTGLLCWATNLHILHTFRVDVAAALELRSLHATTLHSNAPLHLTSSGPPTAVVLARAVYRLFYAYSLWVFAAWAIFRLATRGDPTLVDAYKFIPAVTALSLVMFVISPFNILEKCVRDHFLLAMRRCIFSPASMPVYFSDVVLADIFTSYAKVIGDVWLSLCMILPSGSLLIFPSQDGWSRLMVPCLMSIPYAIRFRQCIIDYMQPTTTTKKPLYNALKYASSFPVIFLSAAQRSITVNTMEEEDSDAEEHPLFRLWYDQFIMLVIRAEIEMLGFRLLSVAINSLYSFWWDVTHDWGLELLHTRILSPRLQSRPPRPLVLPSLHMHGASSLDGPRPNIHARHTSPSHQNRLQASGSHGSPFLAQRHPWGLRARLFFPLPAYPIALFANLLLRLTWSLKLSAHLHARAAAVFGSVSDTGTESEGLQMSGALLFFWLELAELLRRWVWVFFRVEWECVQRITEQEEFSMHTRDLSEGFSSGEGYVDLSTDASTGLGELELESVSTVFDVHEKAGHDLP